MNTKFARLKPESFALFEAENESANYKNAVSAFGGLTTMNAGCGTFGESLFNKGGE